MNNSLMFSSKKSDWETPKGLFNYLDSIYSFTLDAAATKFNSKCKDYISKERDALVQSWYGNVFLNPPYGRKITAWIKKAYHESSCGNAQLVACLLPARTDTRWFHDYCTEASEIIFIKGRVKFAGATSGAPFPSMIFIFKNNLLRTEPIFKTLNLKEMMNTSSSLD